MRHREPSILPGYSRFTGGYSRGLLRKVLSVAGLRRVFKRVSHLRVYSRFTVGHP